MLSTACRLDSYRAASEDRAEVWSPAPDTFTCVVADGVSGRKGGGAASELALALAREALNDPEFPHTDPKAFFGLLSYLDNQLSEDNEAGQTTLVILSVTPRWITGASVGDSEARWITPDGLFELTEAQKKKPYLGQGMATVVPFQLPTPKTGTLLVATDGLFKYAEAGRIAEKTLGEDLDSATKDLVDLARSARGTLLDDIAIVLMRPDSSAPTPLTGNEGMTRVLRWFKRQTR